MDGSGEEESGEESGSESVVDEDEDETPHPLIAVFG
jgi:hypothetical protein